VISPEQKQTKKNPERSHGYHMHCSKAKSRALDAFIGVFQPPFVAFMALRMCQILEKHFSLISPEPKTLRLLERSHGWMLFAQSKEQSSTLIHFS
jgi:hypothetical protein